MTQRPVVQRPLPFCTLFYVMMLCSQRRNMGAVPLCPRHFCSRSLCSLPLCPRPLCPVLYVPSFMPPFIKPPSFMSRHVARQSLLGGQTPILGGQTPLFEGACQCFFFFSPLSPSFSLSLLGGQEPLLGGQLPPVHPLATCLEHASRGACMRPLTSTCFFDIYTF